MENDYVHDKILGADLIETGADGDIPNF